MSYLTTQTDRVRDLARFVGLEDLNGVKAFHVHCVAGELVTVDIERYANVPPDYTATSITRYRLVEVED